MRWGVTQTLTLNGTVNPDFSQVESDAGQFQFDPRQALFFPDKRPFFLDGIEQFATPNNLIYTRRIVAPLAAAKLTGRVGRATSVAYLSAVDDPATSATRDTIRSSTSCAPSRTSAPARRWPSSTPIGSTGPDPTGSPASTRGWCGTRSTACCCKAPPAAPTPRARRSWRRCGRPPSTAPAGATACGPRRAASIRTSSAQSGFISRRGIASLNATNQLTSYGAQGGWLERFTSDVVVDGTWLYDEFVAGRAAQDRKLHFNQNLALRGGWRVGASVLFESFGYDRSLYEDYAVAHPTADGGVQLVPYTGTPRLPNLDYVLSFAVPTRKGLTADGLLLWGKDENFFEWSSADIVFANVGAIWRPTDQLRIEGRYQLQSFQRRTDGSYVGIRRIPRVKVEYQVTRAIFVRVVAEQNRDFVDTLRDDSRTNLPVYIRNAVGIYQPALRTSTDRVRLDWLFSYQPTPGTVVFAGYGSSLEEPGVTADVRRPYRRISDGFFAKISYLFRL